MLAVYATSIATLVAAGLVGHALRALTRFPRAPGLAPAVGLAALLTVAATSVELPGKATTTVVLLVGLAALAVGVLVRTRTIPEGLVEAAVVSALVLAFLAIPFAASGRVGVLGMGNSNDMVAHLTGAFWLATQEIAEPKIIIHGYPLGPHALAAAVSKLGVSLPAAFTGLLVAVPAVGAVTALGAFPAAPRPARLVAAVVVGVPYLVAAYYAQAAFKELVVGVLVLAFVLAARELATIREARRRRSAIAFGLLVAGMVSTYSYLGLAWPFAIGALLLAVYVVTSGGPSVDSVRRVARRVAPVALVAALVVVAGAGAQTERIAAFADAPYANTPLERMGNLEEPVSPFSALGVWLAPDVRFRPDAVVATVAIAAVLCVALLAALAWWVRRRDFAVPVALVACALVYAQATLVKNPYASAKALPVAAPLVALALAVPWLRSWGARRAIAVFGVAVAAAAVVSSGAALRATYVATGAHWRAAEAFRPHVAGAPTLFLGYDDFAPWELRGAQLATVGRLYSPWIVDRRPEKPWARGQSFDFDTVTAATLNQVAYVVAPRTPYASAPPEGFREATANRWYVLWERTTATRERSIPPGESGAPGAPLDCAAAGIPRSSDGVAAVLEPPVVGHATDWAGTAERPGEVATQVLRLPAGRWDISLQYVSRHPLAVTAGSLRTTLPANVGRFGPFWHVGTVTVPAAGELRIAVHPEDSALGPLFGPDAPTRGQSSPTLRPLGEIVATPSPWERELVPVGEACGRYVDWYRLAP